MRLVYNVLCSRIKLACSLLFVYLQGQKAWYRFVGFFLILFFFFLIYVSNILFYLIVLTMF